MEQFDLDHDEFVTNLATGDEVYWTDPDADLCSGVYTVVQVDLKSGVVVLTNKQGSTTEAFLHEIS